MVWYPPGFPLEFTLGHLAGLTYWRTDRLVSCIEVACLVWLSYVLLARHLSRRSWVIAGTVLVGVAAPVFSIYEWVLSETGFTLICLAFVIALEKLLERPTSRRWLFAAAALAWAGYLFRYLGVALIVTGAATLLVGLWPRGWRVAFRHSAVFSVLSLIVPAAWSIRNYEVSGTIAGPRAAQAAGGLGFLLTRMVDTLNAWIWPSIDSLSKSVSGNGEIVEHPVLEVLLVAGIIGVLAYVGFLAWQRHSKRLDPPYGVSMVAVSMLPACYLAVLVYGKTHSDAGVGANNRYLLPIFIPLVVIGIVCMERLLDTTPGRVRATAGRVAFVLLAGAVLVQGFWTERLLDQSVVYGVGFARPTWLGGYFSRFAQALPTGPPVVSNVPWAMWMILHQTVIPTLSIRREEFSTTYVRQLACDHAFLFWTVWPTKQAPTLLPLQEAHVLTQIGSFHWGQIYVLSPPKGSGYCH
jgi:hypothetical protein